jgi:hypothetical protein
MKEWIDILDPLKHVFAPKYSLKAKKLELPSHGSCWSPWFLNEGHGAASTVVLNPSML